MQSRQKLINELEVAQKSTAELKLENSDLQLKVEKLRQQGYQSSSLEKELELRNAKVLRLSRELDKVLSENGKLIQAVSIVKSQLEELKQGGGLDPAHITEIQESLTHLDFKSERRTADTASQLKQPDSVSSKIIADLKNQVEETSKKLAEAMRDLETERIDRANTERRLKAKMEEYERKCIRMSIESSQLKERQTQLDAVFVQQEKAKRSSVSTMGANDKCEKYKADIENFKQERLQLKRLLDSLEADNKELRQELSESRQRLVESASRGSDEEGKLMLMQLKNKLDDQAYCFTVEKSQLTDRIFQLETEFDFLERQKNSKITELEQDLARLQSASKHEVNKSQSSMLDDKWQQLLSDLKVQNADMQDQLSQMESERFHIENMLMESRAAEKKKETAYAELLAKFKQAQDQIHDLRSQNLILEKELVKLNERLGDTLNMNNELEEQLMMLRRVKRT
mmetsp:Transcript_34360/g.60208  ORF Transcript_34360/g.60208 Transcript_34360/m.60208 type:complete len:457 (+) Transcript_34360:205-1575(+)